MFYQSFLILPQNLRYLHVPVPVHVPGNCQTACDDRLPAAPRPRDPASPGVSEGTCGARPSGSGIAEPFPVPLTLSNDPVHARPGARHIPAIAKRPTLTGLPAAPPRETRPAPGLQQGWVEPGKMRFGMGNPGSFWAMIIPSLNPVLQQNFVIYSLCPHPRTGKICSKKAKDVDQRKPR